MLSTPLVLEFLRIQGRLHEFGGGGGDGDAARLITGRVPGACGRERAGHERFDGGVHVGHHEGIAVADARLEEIRRLQGLSRPGAGRGIDQAAVGHFADILPVLVDRGGPGLDHAGRGIEHLDIHLRRIHRGGRGRCIRLGGLRGPRILAAGIERHQPLGQPRAQGPQAAVIEGGGAHPVEGRPVQGGLGGEDQRDLKDAAQQQQQRWQGDDPFDRALTGLPVQEGRRLHGCADSGAAVGATWEVKFGYPTLLGSCPMPGTKYPCWKSRLKRVMSCRPWRIMARFTGELGLITSGVTKITSSLWLCWNWVSLNRVPRMGMSPSQGSLLMLLAPLEDQARQDDGLAGVDVDHRIRLAGQEGRIALNGERRIDLADGGVDRRQDVALVIHVRLDLELHAVVLVGDRDRAEARAHRDRHLTAGEEGGGAAAAGDQARIGEDVGPSVLHGEVDLRGDGGNDAGVARKGRDVQGQAGEAALGSVQGVAGLSALGDVAETVEGVVDEVPDQTHGGTDDARLPVDAEVVEGILAEVHHLHVEDHHALHGDGVGTHQIHHARIGANGKIQAFEFTGAGVAGEHHLPPRRARRHPRKLRE